MGMLHPEVKQRHVKHPSSNTNVINGNKTAWACRYRKEAGVLVQTNCAVALGGAQTGTYGKSL